MSAFKIGIIGGTGLGDPALWESRHEISINTPYGKPSDIVVEGKINGIDCVFMSRHGQIHDISPTKVNYRANIWALWKAGARVILATSACGSLIEKITPGTIVVVDSFYDRTTKREQTFYDDAFAKGVCHIPMHPVFNEKLRGILCKALSALNLPYHNSGTIVCIEGPRFSTPSESRVFRDLFNSQLVGMTICPEAVLAKELGVPYACLALVTDFDCLCEDGHPDAVNVPGVMATLKLLAGDATRTIKEAVKMISMDPQVFLEEIRLTQQVAQDAVMPPDKPIFALTSEN